MPTPIGRDKNPWGAEDANRYNNGYGNSLDDNNWQVRQEKNGLRSYNNTNSEKPVHYNSSDWSEKTPSKYGPDTAGVSIESMDESELKDYVHYLQRGYNMYKNDSFVSGFYSEPLIRAYKRLETLEVKNAAEKAAKKAAENNVSAISSKQEKILSSNNNMNSVETSEIPINLQEEVTKATDGYEDSLFINMTGLEQENGPTR